MGLTKVTYSMIEGATANILDFGADSTGSTDAGPALQAALDYCKANDLALFCPSGTYKINTTVTVTSFAGVTIRGEGLANTVFTRTADASGSAMLILDSCQRGGIYNCGFDGTGMTTGDGVKVYSSLNTTVGVMEFVGNQFANFPGRGLYVLGTVGTPFSSCLIQDNLFLSNGLLDNTAQLDCQYLNDSKFVGNQYGVTAVGSNPPYGCLLYACSAGNYESNYHWENEVGFYAENCNYVRYIGNRFEENQTYGAQIINATKCSMVGNHFHSNSKGTTNTHDHLDIETCSYFNIGDNNFYEWGASVARYSVALNAACNNFVFANNIFNGYGTAPVSYSTNSVEIRFINNIPRQFGYHQARSTWLTFNSGNGVAAGATAYLGPAGQNSDENKVKVVMPYPCVLTKLIIKTTDPGVGQTIAYTVRINNADTSLVGTLTSGVGTVTVSGLVTVAEGDDISVKVVTSAGAAVYPSRVTISVED